MPTWNCPLCGSAYQRSGERRPIVCDGCESLLYDRHAARPSQRQRAGAPDAFAADDESDHGSHVRREPNHPPTKPCPRLRFLGIVIMMIAVALGGVAVSRWTPFVGRLDHASGPLIDVTVDKDDPVEQTFRAVKPWSLEWSMTTSDPMCLSSVQVWDGRGVRIGVVSSRSGRRDFDSVGEHRIAVYASRNDRVRVIVEER